MQCVLVWPRHMVRCLYVCMSACRGHSVMRGNGQNYSLTSVDKHMTSILKTGQWKKQLENNVPLSVWPLVVNMGLYIYHNDLTTITTVSLYTV